MSEADQNKVCPHCAETIRAAAKVCPHCRFWQKRWSLYSPENGMALWCAIAVLIMIFIGMLSERIFGPKNEFAVYRNEITVTSSQVSNRVSGESNVYITVIGMLSNHSDVTWKDVRVEAQFFDKSGKQLDAITVNADDFRGVTVLPHGEAAFKVETKAASPGADYNNYKTAVRWAKDVKQIF